MLAKHWKRIGLIILVIACLINITGKFIKVISFEKAIDEIQSQIEKIKNNEKE